MSRLNLWRSAQVVGLLIIFARSTAISAEGIILGGVVPLSPPGLLVLGGELKAGMEIAVDKLNETGGLLGKKVILILGDTQGLPTKGQETAESLIKRDNAVALAGETQSSVCLAVMEVANKYRLPFINAACSADILREKTYRPVFHIASSSASRAENIVQVLNALGVKRAVAIAENTESGISDAKQMGEQLKMVGRGISYNYLVIDRSIKDFANIILPMKSDPPDVVISFQTPPSSYDFINQIYRLGVAPAAKTWLIEAGPVLVPDFWSKVGRGGEYVLSFTNYHRRWLTPLGNDVRKRYTSKSDKKTPSDLVFQGFDAIWVIAEAIKQTKSTNSEKIISGLEVFITEGTRGKITFSKDSGVRYHQWINIPNVFFQLTEAGQLLEESRIIWPSALATGDPKKPPR